MISNVIILTSGLNGSSVLTGLFTQAGYYTGEKTYIAAGYDTYENQELVDLNIRLFREIGFMWNDIAELPPPSVEKLSELYSNINLEPYRQLIEKCNKKAPWIWKDPRLAYTIYFWRHLLDIEKTKFILMHRNIKQTWTGAILRRKVPYPFNKFNEIQMNCIDHASKFFTDNSIEYLYLTFEDLTVYPEKTLQKINNFVGLELSMDNLLKIYKGKLYKKRWSSFDFIKAMLKFYGYHYLLSEYKKFPRAVFEKEKIR